MVPEAEEWEIRRECSLLHLSDEIFDRPFSTLSSGEQTKALLAALFVRENAFLLIDEPTNHLDETGRRQVAAYLNRKQGLFWFPTTGIFWTDVWIISYRSTGRISPC